MSGGDVLVIGDGRAEFELTIHVGRRKFKLTWFKGSYEHTMVGAIGELLKLRYDDEIEVNGYINIKYKGYDILNIDEVPTKGNDVSLDEYIDAFKKLVQIASRRIRGVDLKMVGQDIRLCF